MKLYELLELFDTKQNCEIIEQGKIIFSGEVGDVTVKLMMKKRIDAPESVTIVKDSILRITVEEESAE